MLCLTSIYFQSLISPAFTTMVNMPYYYFIDHLHWHCLGPVRGLMRPNHSRAGVPVVEMEVKAGVTVEMVPDQGPTTTGGSLKRVQAQWAGIATVTGLVLDVGASQAEPPTPAAATPG